MSNYVKSHQNGRASSTYRQMLCVQGMLYALRPHRAQINNMLASMTDRSMSICSVQQWTMMR